MTEYEKIGYEELKKHKPQMNLVLARRLEEYTSLRFRPAEDDRNKGFCLWCVAAFDSETGMASIIGDRGSYCCHLDEPLDTLAFLNYGGFLKKFSEKTEFNIEASNADLCESEENDELENKIKARCWEDITTPELWIKEVEDISSELGIEVYDLWEIPVMDYPVDAKAMAIIFVEDIRPVLHDEWLASMGSEETDKEENNGTY